MTSNTPDAPVQNEDTSVVERPVKATSSAASVQPVLEKLFELYPQLFGAEFLPLKLGVFQELMAAHPDHFERETLKLALGQHTRSTRYLQSVAAGNKRHDLQGIPGDELAPEHVFFAVVELFRRRQRRSRDDLRPKLRNQLMAAFEASGMTHQLYLARVQTKDEAINALLAEALAEHEQKMAKEEATLRAFDGSGKTPEEFAEMYGLNPRDVVGALKRRERRQAENQPEATDQTAPTPITPDEDPA
ncbi:ProQ/FINO family protein [Rhodoferax sp. PAMC 29310]|uniref:ProQ/FINO family protein n=1 Tax=Rhodoferax sp. PAMC 29310 TaxID=2822760 RepID=UPI001B32DDFC|nr:ProQ/FINO family protein [Rhodoferax sp. PAMC 29310]